MKWCSKGHKNMEEKKKKKKNPILLLNWRSSFLYLYITNGEILTHTNGICFIAIMPWRSYIFKTLRKLNPSVVSLPLNQCRIQILFTGTDFSGCLEDIMEFWEGNCTKKKYNWKCTIKNVTFQIFSGDISLLRGDVPARLPPEFNTALNDI